MPTLHFARLRWTRADPGASHCRGSPERKSPVVLWTRGSGEAGGSAGRGQGVTLRQSRARCPGDSLPPTTRRSRHRHLRRPQIKRAAQAGNAGVPGSRAGLSAWSLQCPWETLMCGLHPTSGLGGHFPREACGGAPVIATAGLEGLRVALGPGAGLLSCVWEHRVTVCCSLWACSLLT